MEIYKTETITRKVNADILKCYISPEYWEDVEFLGVGDDNNATLLKTYFPEKFFIKNGETILPERDVLQLDIDLKTGTVLDWPEGISAKFHYKSYDNNYFILLDNNGKVIFQSTEYDFGIGPSFMNAYCGEYFVLQVGKQGNIIDWDANQMKHSLQQWIEIENCHE